MKKRSWSKITITVLDILLVLCFAVILFIHFVSPIYIKWGWFKFSASGYTRPFLIIALLWTLRYVIVILTKPRIEKNRMTWYYLGIGVIAGATLLLEVAMTRVFAVAFFNHYAFLIISTALFGFGFSGVFLSIFPSIQKLHFDKFLTFLSICFSLSTILTLKIVVDVPLPVRQHARAKHSISLSFGLLSGSGNSIFLFWHGRRALALSYPRQSE